MGLGWANKEETAFLQSYMPKYKLCQVKRNYQHFWPSLFTAYQTQFPLLEKLWPNQSKTLEGLTGEENTHYNLKLKAKHESLKEWFRWRANPCSQNTTNAVTKKDLKSIYKPNRTRGHKSYEVFAKLYRDTVNPIVKEACRVQSVGRTGRLPIWHKVAARLWRNASEEQISAVNAQMEVEAVRDRNEGGSEGSENPKDKSSPEAYQHYLKLLPGVLTATIDPAVRKAGVMAICTFVGPVPEAGGQIIATTLQFGDSEATPLFSSAWPGHEEVFLEHLGRFARKYEFPEQLCMRRSLHAVEQEVILGAGGSNQAFDQSGKNEEVQSTAVQPSSPAQ
ncbi:hypothetical protein NMY22_g16876 [Coprinellus aureogranulatus]|nr:hypothetical protein NMY22_g16876 [Coprinellus aureogranulatus]